MPIIHIFGMTSDNSWTFVYFCGMFISPIVFYLMEKTFDFLSNKVEDWIDNEQRPHKFEQTDGGVLILAGLVWPLSFLMIGAIVMFVLVPITLIAILETKVFGVKI